MIYYIPLNINDFERYKYDPQSDYYNDECNSFTTENKTDILLRERQNDFNKNNLSLCEEMCTFIEYNEEKRIVKCECDIKQKFNSFMNVNVSKYNLVYRFNINKKRIFNFWIFKCYRLIFSANIITSNLFSQIILCIIIFHFFGVSLFCILGVNSLYDKIKIMLIKAYSHRSKILKKKNNNNMNNNKNVKVAFNYKIIKAPPKKQSNKLVYQYKISNLINDNSSQRMFDFQPKFKKNIITQKNKINKGKKIINLKNKNFQAKTDNELNPLSYYDAIIEDKRTFCQIYFSFLRTNHILFLAFKQKNDYNSRIIKICFIFYIFAWFIFINTAFMNDYLIHKIYIFNGKWQLNYSYIFIILITIISCIVKNIFIEIIYTESEVISIKYTFNKNIIKNILGIIMLKSILFFAFGILNLFFFWIYVACFFTVFKNSQQYAIFNTLISFGISLIAPIFFYIIPTIFRYFSLSNRKKKSRSYLYIISKILLVLV